MASVEPRTVLVLTTSMSMLPLMAALGLRRTGFRPVVVQMKGGRNATAAQVTREYGVRYFIGQVGNAIGRRIFSLAILPKVRGIPVVRVEKRDWAELLRMRDKLGAEALVVASFRYKIPLSVIDDVSHLVNIHPGPLPDWRGPDPIWWMKRTAGSKFGATLHRVEKNIDEGEILFTTQVRALRQLPQFVIELLIAINVGRSIGGWLDAIVEGGFRGRVQPCGHYFPMPTKLALRSMSRTQAR